MSQQMKRYTGDGGSNANGPVSSPVRIGPSQTEPPHPTPPPVVSLAPVSCSGQSVDAVLPAGRPVDSVEGNAV